MSALTVELMDEAMAAGWHPPERLRLSEWADREFRMSSETSASPGRWTSLPFQREILDAMADPAVHTVSLIKSARIGYTLMTSAAIAYHIAHEPTSILFVLPRVDDAKSFSKETITPLFRDIPALRRIRTSDTAQQSDEGTMTHKMFPGGVLSLVGANSGAGLRRISRRVVMLDEVDAMPATAGDDGDPVRLARKRSEAFANRKLIAGSTPLVTGTSRIETLFLSGDQRRFHVPCPHCGHEAPMVFFERPNSGWHWLSWTKPEDAHLVCGQNGCVIEHTAKRSIIERGRWVAAQPFTGHASFAINALYSYSPNSTWTDIVKEYLQAKAEGGEAMRTFVNTTLGESYKEAGESIDWERIASRAEDYELGTVPDGVKLITAGVDVQKDRLIMTVCGWGGNRECWVLDYRVLLGKTADAAVWQELHEALGETYAHPGGGALGIAQAAIDAGYQAPQVYDFVRRHPGHGLMSTVGRSGQRPIIGTPSVIDVVKDGRKIPRGARVWTVGIDACKSDLYGRLSLERPAQGQPYPATWIHFPRGLDDEFFRQLTAETQVMVVNKKGFQTLEWRVMSGRENHALDTWVYARAAAEVRGFSRMRPAPATTTVPAPAPPPAPAPRRAERPRTEPPPPAPAPVAAPPPAPAPAPRAPKPPRQGGGWLGRRPGGWLR